MICGNDATSSVVWDPNVSTNLVGNNDSFSMLKLLAPAIDFRRVHLTPNYFRQAARYDFTRYDLIWNAISDEVQNAKTLAIAAKLVAGTKLPVVNLPALIPRTSRIETARRLQGIDGAIVPKVLVLRNPTRERVSRQVDDAGFAFPAILRKTGTHNGEVVGIIKDIEGLETIFGDRRGEYNLIEFVDVRQSDDFYRKTRFFFVGDQVITRQHIISDDWLVHGRSSRRIIADHPELIDESRDKLVNGFASLPAATRQAVETIRQRVGLDYFGLDCCLLESGEIVVFECNATMNFNPSFRNPAMQHNRASWPRYMSAMRRLIGAKLASRGAR